MSNAKLYFWAQSLDNNSPDLIFENEEELSNVPKRKRIISEIYNFSGKIKPKHLTESDVSLRYDKDKFVIEVLPIERDNLNRLAPILIYGDFPSKIESAWIEDSCSTIEKVILNKFNRNLSKDVLPAIKKHMIDMKSSPINMRILHFFCEIAKHLKNVDIKPTQSNHNHNDVN